MLNKFTAACIQLNSNNNLHANIKLASELITAAATAGAEFIALPENAFLMGASDQEKSKFNLPMKNHLAVLAMGELAAKLKIWLLFCVIVPNEPKMLHKRLKMRIKHPKLYHNRSILLNPNGKIVKFYNKIYLFDVDIPGGESHRESATIVPGEDAVIVDLPCAKLGMTICYDLRFPNLFRELAQAGAQIITVPAAFTYKTGEAHWHSLLRARAIETTSYIIASAQCGHHPGGRYTYGHSMIISPWGEILAEATENNEEFVIAEIDLARLKAIRSALPSLKHDRGFKIP